MMQRHERAFVVTLAVLLPVPVAVGQSSSLLRPPRMQAADRNRGGLSDDQANTVIAPRGEFAAAPPKEVSRPVTRSIERMSVIAISPVPLRKFKVHDLISIIVRQQKKYEADGKLDTKKQWDINGKLEDWFRFYPRERLGQDKLSNGKPGFDFKYMNKYKTNAENEREDKFTTRVQATIVDVKPNGNLMLEASLAEEHDEEKFTITLTGVCRSEDVTPDNSVLSTQIAEMTLIERNHGAVRDATQRGWVPKVLDWIRPF